MPKTGSGFYEKWWLRGRFYSPPPPRPPLAPFPYEQKKIVWIIQTHTHTNLFAHPRTHILSHSRVVIRVLYCCHKNLDPSPFKRCVVISGLPLMSNSHFINVSKFQIGNKFDALASTSDSMFKDSATMDAFCKEKGFAGMDL